MSREWKPGDVAKASCDGDELIYLRVRSRYNENGERWESQEGSHSYAFEAADWFRPLVVIDPEDREQVERLSVRFHNEFQGERRVIEGGYVDAMQAALREFADPKPPKPDEPTGLGAVVEDAEGRRWIRADDGSDGQPWCALGGGDIWLGWPEIDFVRVLHEGWSQ